MASFESLQERLAALHETTSQLRDLIDRLAHIQFQPGSVPLSATDEDNVAAELSAEISQVLRDEEEDLELLQEEIIDLRAGRPGSDAEHRKTRLRDGAARLQADLAACRASFRKAQLVVRGVGVALPVPVPLGRRLPLFLHHPPTANQQCHPQPQPQHPSMQQPTSPRSHLLPPHPRPRQKKKTAFSSSSDDATLTASQDITFSLRRTHSLIASSLSQSAFAAQTLAESSAALEELQQSYEGLDGLLARSRELVGTLATAQRSDTWYLQAAVRLLLATLVWLVFRRWVYGPVWWLVWLPVRTGWRVGKGVVTSSSSAASSSKMQVVQPGEMGGRVVGVGEEGAVPTVRIGREEVAQGDPESMVEKVGRMVEDTLDQREGEAEEGGEKTAEDEVEGGGQGIAKDELGDQPNPMKRMWVEGEGDIGQGVGVRDEL
ncbi:hypothetical protein C8A05DRAFT_29343 [Staphylotrichum tortipilum]|uniref:Sec20 C-terminal domain-containing protein n=1 Tax=Staphylotrichum tortipilum TaxID=2831512 RepID=A0AAN6RX62_9PEZI|nr:hypothetical protein C8A05DRAFT_29343 [Staphylotrichum longicolle]